MEDQETRGWIDAARAVSEKAYAPYSKFHVGAVVVGESGKTYVGCNVESATYGATICAERSAICRMIADGEQKLRAVVVFVDADEPAMPCGICRQLIAEHGAHADIITATREKTKTSTIERLLPDPFVFLPD